MRVIFVFKRLFAFLLIFVFIPDFAYAKDIEISAQKALVMDAYTNRIIFEKNKDVKSAVASTTKIMTCLIACETGNLSESVLISDEMLQNCEGSSIGLEAGDEITLYDLICGAMIASGNDAANAIAFHISGSLESFAKLMNEKAKTIGMNNSYFTTPSGLDFGNNSSTAYDMALLAVCALKNETLLEISSMKSAVITVNGKKQTLYNHNKLLDYSDNFIGLKTGYTKKAGRCLVSAYKYGDNIIICVTLNAPDDWKDHKTLVKSAKKCYKNISKTQTASINVVGAVDESVECRFEFSVKALGSVEVKLFYYPFVYAPVNKGDILGRADIYIGNSFIKSVDITANKDVERWEITK